MAVHCSLLRPRRLFSLSQMFSASANVRRVPHDRAVRPWRAGVLRLRVRQERPGEPAPRRVGDIPAAGRRVPVAAAWVWLTTELSSLDGAKPLTLLAGGEADRVAKAAEGDRQGDFA